MAKQKKRSKKPIYILASLLIVVALGLLVAAKSSLFSHSSSKTTSNGPTPQQQKQASAINAQQKQAYIEKNTSNSNTTTPPPSNSSPISLSAKEETNGTVTVYTSLGNFSDGTCKLTITNGTRSTSQTADVIYQPQSSICAGFSVPIDSVGKGQWTLQLTATSSAGTSKEASAQLSVQ